MREIAHAQRVRRLNEHRQILLLNYRTEIANVRICLQALPPPTNLTSFFLLLLVDEKFIDDASAAAAARMRTRAIGDNLHGASGIAKGGCRGGQRTQKTDGKEENASKAEQPDS